MPGFLEDRSSVSCLPTKTELAHLCQANAQRQVPGWGNPERERERANGKWVTVFGTVKKHEETVEESQL